jgi:hypothetical protein
VDGTRLKANASKHRGVSYQRSGELIEQLELEVQELLRQAEAADCQSEADPHQLPEEIGRRQALAAKLQAARQQIEARRREELEAEMRQYQKRQENYLQRKRRGHPPRPPQDRGPDPKAQANLTDPDSRIMRKSKNEAFAQAYNGQLAVDAEGSQLILGTRISQNSADNNQLQPMLEGVEERLGQPPRAVLADSGYLNGEAIEQIQARGIEAFIAVSAEAANRRPYDLRQPDQRRENPRSPKAPVLVAMAQKLQSPEGRQRYLRRQASVEPVIGILKRALGFNQFLLRGLEKVSLEWELVCLAYNCKRLHKLMQSA